MKHNIRMSPAATDALAGINAGQAATRAATPTLATILESNTAVGSQMLDFATTQTIEQSNLPLAKRSELYSSLRDPIARREVPAITEMMSQYGLGERFESQTRFLTSKGGQEFISNQLPNITQSTIAGQAPSAIKWTDINLSTPGTGPGAQRFMNKMQVQMAEKIGIDPSLMSVSFAGGTEAEFLVQGRQQKARVFEFKFSIANEAIDFKIPIYNPSKEGYLVQSRDTMGRQFTKGSSIYITPENYFVDPIRQQGSTKVDLTKISGKDSHVRFQEKQLELLGKRIQEVRIGSGSPEYKRERIKQLTGSWKSMLEKHQFRVGHAGTLGAAPGDPLQRANQNLLSKAAMMRSSAALDLEYASRQIRNMEDKRLFIDAMNRQGASFPLASGQVMRGVMGMNYELGLPHSEPTKALSERTPIGPTVRPGRIVPSVVDLYQSEGTKLINQPGFKPQGIRALGMVIPETQGTASKFGLGATELFLPDGTVVASTRAFSEGLFDTVEAGQYKIKATGPGSTPTGTHGELIRSIFQGGQLPDPTQPGKMIEIKGLMNTKATGTLNTYDDFLKGLGAKNVSHQEMRQKFQGGIPLPKDQFLGFDPVTGEKVMTSKSKHISETLTFVHATDKVDAITLQTSKVIAPYTDPRGNLVAQPTKLVSELMTKQAENPKVQTNPYNPRQMKNLVEAAYGAENLPDDIGDVARKKLAGSVDDVDLIFRKGLIGDPRTTLAYQAGAMQYSLEKNMSYFKDVGQAKQAKQLLQRSSTDILKQISSGNILQDLSEIADLSDPKMAHVKKILGQASKESMDKKLAAVSFALFSNLPEAQKMEALSNVFSPYTKLGTSMGFNDFGKQVTDPEATVNRFFNWSEAGDPTTLKGQEATRWREGKIIQQELNEAFNSSQMATNVLAKQDTPFKFYTPGLAMRGENILPGKGQRGTLEPRFFGQALASPELQPIIRELSQRGTDFTPMMNKIRASLEGRAPLSTTQALGLKDVFDDTTKELIGHKDLTVNLGMTKDTLREAQRVLDRDYKLGTKIMPEVYVPGGEDMRGMQLMVTGTGTQKDKPLRQIYTDYFKQMREAQKSLGTEQANAIAKATATFKNDLTQVFKGSFTGVGGGEARGMQRPQVKGSVYSLATAPSAALKEQMGYLQSSGTVSLKNIDLETLGKQRAQFKYATSEFGAGRVQFVSTAQVDKMYKEAIDNAYQMKNKVEGRNLAKHLRQQRQELKAGGSALGARWRHPGIGPRSMGATIMFEDLVTPGTAEGFFASSFEEYKDVRMKMGEKELRTQLQVGIAKDMAMDLDGDFQNMAVAGKKDSQMALSKLMKEGDRHALKYGLIKEIVKESVSKQASLHGSGTSIVQTFANKEIVQSAAAHWAPDTVVPKVSNALTELKYVVATSSLADESKHTLNAFFEAAEQVPIANKHLYKQSNFGIDFVKKMSDLRNNMFNKDAAVRLRSFTDFFDTLFDKELSETASVELLGKNVSDTKISLQRNAMQADLVNAFDEVVKRDEAVNFIKFWQRKTSVKGLSHEEIFRAWDEKAGTDLVKLHGNALKRIDKAGADLSNRVIDGINEGYERAGKVAAGKLPTKGIVGVAATAAASMLIVGAASMALGPTWKDAQTGGAYADPEYLFPDEMEHRQTMLHGQSLPTPVSGNLITPSYEATVHMAPGSYSSATLAGRLGTIMGSRIGSARLEVNDHRSSLDSLTLSKIRNEII